MPLYDFSCGAGHRFERFVPLAHFHDAQSCECGETAHRRLSAPRVISDTIEPRRGADGKIHTSLASYRHSLTPEGNPKGERFFELAPGEELKGVTKDFDRKQRREDIKAGIADVKNGRVPPVVTGDLP